MSSGPNRGNSQHAQISPAPGSFSSFNHNNFHRPSTSPSNIISTHPAAPIYHSQSSLDQAPRHGQSTARGNSPPSLLPVSNSSTSRSTLWWGDLEAWMDEAYAQQVCTLMGWDPVNIKVPHPAAEPSSTQQPPNNPGYCFLTFPSHAHAAAVLAQINNAGKPVQMPNSSRPFVLNWASSVPTSASSTSPAFSAPAFTPGAVQQQQQQQQQFQKEYSIFVGDLAPETSNSDLVAVFRNPVLGLRNDREPKYIRPFSSCKSAKIMLDPITGVSRGYGFVRFTDEADQQRALIEMHGLYCLSRPMRISPATAKHKSQAPPLPPSLPFDVPAMNHVLPVPEQKNAALTVALPLPPSTTSVSAPIAATTSNQSITSNGGTTSTSTSSMGGSNSSTSISSNSGSNSSLTSAEDAQHALNQLAKHYANGELGVPDSLALSLAQHAQLRQVLQNQQSDPAPRFVVQEEHWKHHAQARAILGNLIGPNGEQLTSTDPYNTTVFVGGLSPLISEETLRTFFAPFGDIHYVKVPVGKHCGFVQFVRKADAERAIEKMQGFPIGGSKIRLNKAAQAAAQAAQAALQTPYATQPGTLTQDQALALLQKFALQNYRPDQLAGIPHLAEPGETDPPGIFPIGHRPSEMLKASDEPVRYDQYASYLPRPEVHRTLSNFSPFSPDPATVGSNSQPRNSAFLNIFSDNGELKAGTLSNGATSSARVSPPGSRPSSTSRYGLNAAPIARPSSGPASGDADPLHDINNTLASLELDRPSSHSSQFHFAANSSP
ncbi:RNA-binding protein Csx1 [Coprinopsis sp. MPI-PUGE-AT-0042]|nr:RNA-binding protein Csx1 [Coprinopsis sp. MPI-PUGE-AT-0042]